MENLDFLNYGNLFTLIERWCYSVHDAGVIGEKELRVLRTGVEPTTFQLVVLFTEYPCDIQRIHHRLLKSHIYHPHYVISRIIVFFFFCFYVEFFRTACDILVMNLFTFLFSHIPTEWPIVDIISHEGTNLKFETSCFKTVTKVSVSLN